MTVVSSRLSVAAWTPATRLSLAIGALAGVCLFQACSSVARHDADEGPVRHVHICLVHAHGAPVENARVKIGEYSTAERLLMQGGTMTHLFFKHPVVSPAEVVYRPAGSSSEVSIRVPLPDMRSVAWEHVTLVFRLNAARKSVSISLRKGIGLED